MGEGAASMVPIYFHLLFYVPMCLFTVYEGHEHPIAIGSDPTTHQNPKM